MMIARFFGLGLLVLILVVAAIALGDLEDNLPVQANLSFNIIETSRASTFTQK